MTTTAAPPSCPACDSDAVDVIERWPVARGRTAAACRGCGLLFTHPPPASEVLAQYYGHDGNWHSTHAIKSANAQTKTKRAAPALLAVLDRYFPASQPPPGASVFDFGCGTGAWLNSFQDRGWKTYGLEPSTDVAFVRHARLDSVPADARFDLLIVWHVLEHLPRPLDTLRTLAASVAPGGYCLVSVPRVDTLAVHRDLPYVLRPPAHIAAYTEACLRGLMSMAGMATVIALHELDDAFSKGAPLRLRLLAKKDASAVSQASPAAALTPVLAAAAEIADAGTR